MGAGQRRFCQFRRRCFLGNHGVSKVPGPEQMEPDGAVALHIVRPLRRGGRTAIDRWSPEKVQRG